jgi:hypothetical protein
VPGDGVCAVLQTSFRGRHLEDGRWYLIQKLTIKKKFILLIMILNFL